MEDRKWQQSWNSPVVFLLVVAWALVAGAFFQMWAANIDGRDFEFNPIFAIAFPFAFGVLGMVIFTLVDLVARRQLRPLAYLNFGTAVVLGALSIGTLDLTFGWFGIM
jgi:hypothetical protein